MMHEANNADTLYLTVRLDTPASSMVSGCGCHSLSARYIAGCTALRALLSSALFARDYHEHSYSSKSRMADVIGILSFALHAAHKVYDAIQMIKDAPDTVRTLGRESSRVRGLLTLMLPRANGKSSQLLHGIDNPLVKVLVEDARKLVTMVDALFGKAMKQKGDGTHQVRKYRWLLHAGEAARLCSHFQTFHGSLTAVYALIISYV